MKQKKHKEDWEKKKLEWEHQEKMPKKKYAYEQLEENYKSNVVGTELERRKQELKAKRELYRPIDWEEIEDHQWAYE